MRERKQRSLHCSPREQAEIRVRASAAGKTVTRYVLDLALADDPDGIRWFSLPGNSGNNSGCSATATA